MALRYQMRRYNNIMKLTKNFSLTELIHPDIYKNPAIGSRANDFLHKDLAKTCQLIRDNVGPITINNWAVGGHYVDSGLRMPMHVPSHTEIAHILSTEKDSEKASEKLIKLFKGVGALLSDHKEGCAADLKPKDVTVQALYNHILDNQELYPAIVRIENIEKTPTWVHVTVGHRHGRIKIFN